MRAADEGEWKEGDKHNGEEGRGNYGKIRRINMKGMWEKEGGGGDGEQQNTGRPFPPLR